MRDLSGWTGCERPQRRVLEGEYVRLEPLDASRHGDDLFAVSSVADARDRFAWLPEHPPESREAFQVWMERAETSEDTLFFAVVEIESGRALGRQALMRIDAANGVAEIGNVYWGPGLSRKAGASEAFFLMARYVFEDLGYRRFEWKCNAANAPSRRAAQRFGFTEEGVFRQHMVVKGANRDTAWFSVLDHEWPLVSAALREWLAPGNFDAANRQRERLEAIRARIAGPDA
ncbi:GNAT family N-acetyltransferase [Pararhizobium mangrovi]|uniref:GNAT family N-acetyltransferase n=1 Tax=Pararhizobium mangrovi TaxID=2590452 RepID=A0A506UFQ9_9HYPH|nr:GNAT family protein [Pararhizobium mangrovi]TPW30687.1 GNAT family N-acetyltransferase [Pararhizobium mangrovi]